MGLDLKWNCRSFMGSVGMLAGSLLTPRKIFASKGSTKITGFGQSGNPYEELGVKTVINCEGTMTMLGGSLLRPELEAVMAQAGRHFVHVPDLEVAAGKRISEMLKLPDGYTALVTSGAAAAMQSGLATVHQTDSRSDGDEIRGDYPEIASQPVRPSTPDDRSKADRDRDSR